MRRISRIPKILAAGAGFLLGSATALSAGVVMSETAISNGPIGAGVQHRTIYIQNGKQKVDNGDMQTITDLDKGVIYLIDKGNKSYLQMPLRSPGRDLSGDSGTLAIELKRTGSRQVVAAHSCDEYRGREADDVVQITVSACVSKSAPGVREIAHFDRRMLKQIAGLTAGKELSAGVVLEKKFVLNLRLPEPSRPGYRIASVMTRTKVDDIAVKPLAEQTFAPPKGYSRIQSRPQNLPDEMRSVRARPDELSPAFRAAPGSYI